MRQEGDLCERCRQEESESDQSSQPTYPGYQQSQEEALKDWLQVGGLRLVDSHAARELERLVKELIPELYRQDGPFWEVIQDLRAR